MNFIAANNKLIAVCGRHNVYVFPAATLANNAPAPIVSKRVFTYLEILDHIPSGTRKLGSKICIVTAGVSDNGKYVAISDSAKNMYVFEETGTGWELFASWEMEKRVTRVIFDRRTTFVIMADKTGDIWISYMSLKLIKTPKKILGHSSFILDLVVNEDNNRIITCDRDEKIRVSHFPEAHAIDEFMLGHKEAVVNIAIVNHGFHILSISSEGTLKVWKAVDHSEVVTFNVFAQLQEKERKERDQTNEVIRMRATDTLVVYHVAVMISGFAVMPVFEVNGVLKKIRLCAHVQMDTDWADMAWANQSLFLFAPHLNLFKRYYVTPFGLAADPNSAFFIHTSSKLDMHAYAEFNQPFFPIKNRVGSEILNTVAGAKEAIIAEYGAITEDESAPVTLPRTPTPPTPPNSSHTLPHLPLQKRRPRSQDPDYVREEDDSRARSFSAASRLRVRRPPPSSTAGRPSTSSSPSSSSKPPKPKQSPSKKGRKN